jgi:hypothetical protein
MAKTKLKYILKNTIIAISCLFVFSVFSASCIHPDPLFNIGNNFPQTVTVYFNRHNEGTIDPGKTRIFYPNDGKILSKEQTDLLVELKSSSGIVLFSKLYSHDELWEILASVKGQPYWIGPETR